MKILSVICEFDPFHNGHAYLLSQARQKSGAEYTVCIMSGCVTQRGTFSRYDKRLRAKAALLHGADLVIELPVRLSCAGADVFAAGGIALASALGDEVFSASDVKADFFHLYRSLQARSDPEPISPVR